jgi:hypothetical protein
VEKPTFRDYSAPPPRIDLGNWRGSSVCVCVWKNKNKRQKLTFFYNFRNTHALHAYLYTH